MKRRPELWLSLGCALLLASLIGCVRQAPTPPLPSAPPVPVAPAPPVPPAPPPGAFAVFTWDMQALGAAMQLPPDAVREYFTDGRRVSFILERRIARELLQGRLADSEGAPYDVVDAQGGRWEVRSLTDRGMYFCPSNQVGSSRHFDEAGFLKKLDGMNGYIVSDIDGFPTIPVYRITTKQVRAWWDAGELGSGTKVSREKALALFRKAAGL